MYFSSKVLSSIFVAAAIAASVSADDHAKKPYGGKDDYGKEPWGKHGDTDASPALTDLASHATGVCGFTRTTLPPVTRTQVILETDMATVVQCEVTTTTTSTVCSTTTICENTPTGNAIEPTTTCTTGGDHYKPTPEPDFNAGKSGQEGPDGPAKPDDDDDDDKDDDEDDDSKPTTTAAARRFRA